NEVNPPIGFHLAAVGDHRLAVVNSGLVSGLIGREIAASCLDRLMIKIKTARRKITAACCCCFHIQLLAPGFAAWTIVLLTAICSPFTTIRAGLVGFDRSRSVARSIRVCGGGEGIETRSLAAAAAGNFSLGLIERDDAGALRLHLDLSGDSLCD